MGFQIKYRVGEQNEAYRKGLVLGLTMAEVGILIIFVLLLLLALGEVQRAETARKSEGKTLVDRDELANLTAARTALHTVAQELGVSVQDPLEDFTRLVRIVREAASAPGVQAQLRDARSALDDIQRARAELHRLTEAAGIGTDSLLRQMQGQAYQLANQQGQLSRLEAKLQASGQGKGERPCWARPNGTIDYLYEVVLASDGIKMRELASPGRQRERALLPMPEVRQEEVLSENTFLNRTRPLFLASKQNDCRFFVIVYDATATHEKPIYKDLLRTVERHFYKRLSTASAPF